ncbi:MAG: hypothetical protein KDJ16_11535 [Hyphomicrobiales bacterium]|nr:hypothetical protein [Hyphomicrobiales bacterium]
MAVSSAEAAPAGPPVLAETARAHLPLVAVASHRRYFVILGTFRSRYSALRRCGRFPNAYIVDTYDYPNFTNGYYACVDGPYSRRYADDLLWSYKRAVYDAYVKAGW